MLRAYQWLSVIFSLPFMFIFLVFISSAQELHFFGWLVMLVSAAVAFLLICYSNWCRETQTPSEYRMLPPEKRYVLR
jgi:K+ transporter